MELNEFVKKTLLQILDGINSAQTESSVGVISPEMNGANVQTIKFDVAVTVEESVGSDAGAKINVFGSKVGAEIEGKKASETATRINFEVRMIYPYGKRK